MSSFQIWRGSNFRSPKLLRLGVGAQLLTCNRYNHLSELEAYTSMYINLFELELTPHLSLPFTPTPSCILPAPSLQSHSMLILLLCTAPKLQGAVSIVYLNFSHVLVAGLRSSPRYAGVAQCMNNVRHFHTLSRSSLTVYLLQVAKARGLNVAAA